MYVKRDKSRERENIACAATVRPLASRPWPGKLLACCRARVPLPAEPDALLGFCDANSGILSRDQEKGEREEKATSFLLMGYWPSLFEMKHIKLAQD